MQNTGNIIHLDISIKIQLLHIKMMIIMMMIIMMMIHEMVIRGLKIKICEGFWYQIFETNLLESTKTTPEASSEKNPKIENFEKSERWCFLIYSLNSICGHLGGNLEPSWSSRAIWEAFGAIWEPFGAILEASGTILEPLLVPLAHI